MAGSMSKADLYTILLQQSIVTNLHDQARREDNGQPRPP